MKLKYDFHLHSCLSPCGDADMSPANLVRMASVLELNAIALCDHNTVGNCSSAMQVGNEVGVTVIPGMELCTSEEIHLVCLFDTLRGAEKFDALVKSTLPPIKNKPQLYGEQVYMDCADNILGQEEILLVTASGISIEEAPGLCRACGGICYPAHVERSSYSVFTSLGVFPTHLGFCCAEVSLKYKDAAGFAAQHPSMRDLRILRSSDAHYLENMSEALDTLEVGENTVKAILDALTTAPHR